MKITTLFVAITSLVLALAVGNLVVADSHAESAKPSESLATDVNTTQVSTQTGGVETPENVIGDPQQTADPAPEKLDQASIVPQSDEDKAKGVEVWGNIYKVLSHPRCVNCHVEDDRPRWSGKHYGKTQLHGMYVHATATRVGMPGQQMCSTCHAKTNSDVPHGPPGAEVWALAPPEMVWWGKSSQELCAIVKDPAKTGGLDITGFADHIGHDPLVAWGWEPGVGREPAPFSADETVAMLEQWLALGLPCPE